jgi:hypothetical protein
MSKYWTSMPFFSLTAYFLYLFYIQLLTYNIVW